MSSCTHESTTGALAAGVADRYRDQARFELLGRLLMEGVEPHTIQPDGAEHGWHASLLVDGVPVVYCPAAALFAVVTDGQEYPYTVLADALEFAGTPTGPALAHLGTAA
jgi:hypothetical protein